MNPTFSYSFDRETFLGTYPSRKEALAAGTVQARMHPDAPATVFVGQQVYPSLRTFGHARTIIDEMRRRVSDDVGELADEYLRRVSEPAIADLDNLVEQAIVHWLERNDLKPRFHLIEAISEHSVPMVSSHYDAKSNDEVQSIGESDYLSGL